MIVKTYIVEMQVLHSRMEADKRELAGLTGLNYWRSPAYDIFIVFFTIKSITFI